MRAACTPNIWTPLSTVFILYSNTEISYFYNPLVYFATCLKVQPKWETVDPDQTFHGEAV